MYSIKINGITYDKVPSSIEDVSIGRFIKFRNFLHSDPLELICWALDARPIFPHTDTIENELGKLLGLINPVVDEIYAFMKSQDRIKTPDTISVMGYDVKLKKGLLNDLPYWPYVVTKNIIMQERVKDPFDTTDRIPEVLAHYLYTAVTKNEYNEAKANEFVEVVNDIAMVPAIQLSNFFLLKQTDLFPSNNKSLSAKLKKFIKRQG